jgi:hypothetical protein
VSLQQDAGAPSIVASLSRIKEVTEYQKSLYDDLSKKIQQIDERLSELSPGVEVKVELPTLDGAESGNGASAVKDYVGFNRGPKGWHLHYLRRHDEKNKVVYFQLLTEARRDFQIRAIEHFPRLMEEIVQQTEYRTDEIRNSLEMAQSIADSLT